MKRISIVAATAALACVVIAPSASARHTLAHRVTALETKVTTLQRDVRTLRREATTLARGLSCFTGGVGVAQFGGYVYDPDGTGPQPEVYTSALDVAGQGETPGGYFALIDPACLTGRSTTFLEAVLWPAPLWGRVGL
jgi:hypothetical protein